MGFYEKDFKSINEISQKAEERLQEFLLSSDDVLSEDQIGQALFYIAEKYGAFYLDIIFEKWAERQDEFLPSLLRYAGERCDYSLIKYLVRKVKNINMIVSPARNYRLKETLLDVVAQKREDADNTISLIEGYTYIIDLLRRHGAKYAKELR